MRHLLVLLLLSIVPPLTAAEEAAADTAQAQPQQEQPAQEQAQPQPQEQPPAEAAAPQDDTAQKEEPANEGDAAKKDDAAKKEDGKKEGEEEDGGDDSGDSDGEFYIAAKAELGFGFGSIDSTALNFARDDALFNFEAGIGGEFGYKFWIPFEVGLGFAYRYRLLADGLDIVDFGTGNSMLPYVAARFYIPLVLFDLYPDIRVGCDIHLGGDSTTMALFYGQVGVGFLFLKFFLVELGYSFEIGDEQTGANRIKDWRLNVFTVRGGVRF